MLGLGLGLNARRSQVAGGGGGAASASSTQWRLLFPAGAEQDTDFNTDMYISEVEMRGEIGGADLCTGGTASASHEPFGASFNASKAFDDSAGSDWANEWETQDNCWLQYTFASAVTIEELQMTFAEPVRQPVAFFVQYFDGTDWVTYFDSDIEANGSLGGAYANGATDTFSTPWTESEGFDRWRLLINDGAASGTMYLNYVTLSDAGAIRRSYAGAVSASSELGGSFAAAKAFDEDTGSWVPSPTSGDGSWLEYAFFRKEQIEQVTIRNAPSQGDNGPRDVSVQYFDGAIWVTDWGFTTGAWSSTQETRTFIKP